ncbi:uncharacterized protein [Nicotiana tomentosiformis]|uniref:uncharacterized protein n=1 Tax=Nicotiana tomentosiformis TaxID=4098 RepID=UPI00388C6DFE
MANPSKNSSSSPKETTTTSSITPSITPTFKKGRFKMLAPKVVTRKEQIKKINKQLMASQGVKPQKSEDSFKSATEGKETVLSEIEQVTSGPKVTSEVTSEATANLETRFVLVGKVAEEPHEDLLKKVSDSYNPKKKMSSGVRVPGTARANKKRKDASSTHVETTRSDKKQSEAELEKALEESKRKVAAKETRRRDEEEAEEMEVVTPKAKKIKTSTKKFVSKTKSARPSTLVKRTRSDLKSSKLEIVKE